VQGQYEPTGAVPTFVEDMKTRGISINRNMFDPNYEHGTV
jgi:hypothetical protein